MGGGGLPKSLIIENHAYKKWVNSRSRTCDNCISFSHHIFPDEKPGGMGWILYVPSAAGQHNLSLLNPVLLARAFMRYGLGINLGKSGGAKKRKNKRKTKKNNKKRKTIRKQKRNKKKTRLRKNKNKKRTRR